MKDNFAVFIMVHGRPDKMWTYHTLRKAGYSGKIYLVADDLDKTVSQYKEKYRDELIVFDKKKAALEMDAGDNTGDLRSTLFSANTIFDLAKERGVKYFFIMCDDYTGFEYRYNSELMYGGEKTRNLDKVFEYLLEFYKSNNAKTIAFAQSGDFMGGKESGMAKQIKLLRKAMNTFLCSTDRPFKFVGRMNEDVTTYVNLGSKGDLFLTVTNVSIFQNSTQKEAGGLTDLYLEYGTYIKSFFSVMYNPSCVKVYELGRSNKRLHHQVRWNNAVPKILNEKYRKNGTK
tara:strand:- start:182 stop:1042 length:861 start_codon:yes stop_codon:yes gene_type:complete